MQNSNFYAQLVSLLETVSPSLKAAAPFFPMNVTSLQIDEKTGEFKIDYPKEQEGRISCDEPSLKGILEESILHISSRVMGVIERGKGLHFKSGLSIEANLGFLKLDIPLTDILVKGPDILELIGSKWGQSKSFELPIKDIIKIKIEFS